MHSFSSLLVWYGVMMASELLLLQEQKGEVNGVVVCRVVVCVPLCFSVKSPKADLTTITTRIAVFCLQS